MNRSAGRIAELANTYANLCTEGPETDEQLLAELAAVSVLVRLGQAEQTRLAGEIADRSKDRTDSLAARHGCGSAANLVAETAGIPRDQAGTITANGRTFRTDGEDGPRFPLVAAALTSGLLDTEVAAAMRRTLSKCAPGITPEELAQLEQMLLDEASKGYPADLLIEWLRQVPDHAYPGSGRPSNAEPDPIPVVRRKVLKNGFVRWVMYLDAVTDGFLKTAVDANSGLKRTGLVTEDMPKVDPVTEDRRPLAQRWVDAIHRIAKHAVASDTGEVAGTAVTLLVTVTDEALRSDLGVATLPDCGTTVSAGMARMLAADAEIIPVVLGTRSQPLDLGYGARTFSMAQRRAMVIRDGGCVGPGCDAPPSWCDGAHIRPAGYGRTDLDNGVLLCWRCHLLHDLHGWQLLREHDRWWWIAPPDIDPTGRKRPGGRIPPATRPA